MAAKDSPLKQFEIVPFSKTEPGGYDISFTNSSLSMIITVAVITLFLTLTVNPRSLVPSRMQLVSELMYNFIANLLSDTVGDNGKKYFHLFFPFSCLFLLAIWLVWFLISLLSPVILLLRLLLPPLYL